MKAKLIAIVVFALLAVGAAHTQGRDDGPRSSRVVISSMTEISNDIHMQGYGPALGLVSFSSESSAAVDSTQSSNNNSVDLWCGSNMAMADEQALKGAQGAVGANVAPGVGNVQSNDVVLVAVDVGRVFVSAQALNNQTDPGESLSIGNALNKVSLGGSALDGAKGTIGVNTVVDADEL